LDELTEARSFEEGVNGLVCLSFVRVEVELKSTLEDSRVLGNRGDLFSQGLQLNFAYVNSIDKELSCLSLHDSE